MFSICDFSPPFPQPLRHKYKCHVDEDTCIEVLLKVSESDSDVRWENRYSRKELAGVNCFTIHII